MGFAQKKSKATVAEYFDYLEGIQGRAEYFDGNIYDIAGGEPEHSRIAGNCTGAMFGALMGSKCSVFSNDLHVGSELSNAYFFPDITVVCGALERASFHPRVVMNPHVIVEVLSKSTAYDDRTTKLIRYMQIASLREYILIEQVRPQVDVCFINDAGVWDVERIEGLEGNVNIRSLNILIPMALIYLNVEFPQENAQN